MEKLKFCYEKKLKSPSSKNGMYRAVAYKAKYWEKNRVLKILFLGGTDRQKADVRFVINQMLSPLLLGWEEVYDKSISDIRISFRYGYGSYSYIGTDAMFIPKEEETLNLGWDGLDVIYHEFGHALGLLHEHQNPKGGIQWNEEEVIKSLSGPPNYWSEASIRFNVLNKVRQIEVDATNFDKDSMMLYYFPNSWTIGDFQTNSNITPSEIDLKFLFDKYGEVDTISPVITLVGEPQLILEYGEAYVERGATAIDNLDGDITDYMTISGEVDAEKEGIQYVVYRATDKAGNTSEKIRTVLIKDKIEEEKVDDKKGCLPSFLVKLFPTKYRMGKLTESQILVMADEFGIPANKSGLKRDTLDKVWNYLAY